jgi:dienelactone hydrolase
MKLTSFKTILSAGFCIIISSCGNQQTASTNSDTTQSVAVDSSKLTPSIKTDSVLYSSNGKQSRGYIAYDENKKGKLPVVVVMPEWWGITSYTKSRARQLAELGYFAIDADPFGKGDTATNPKEAMAFTKPYYTNPQLALTILNAAISKAATFPQADTSRIAAIGYCF